MRTPSHIPSEVLAPDVDRYIREVRRIRRAEIRASLTERAPGEEPLTLSADEIETYVDIIEAMVKVAGSDPDAIDQLLGELDESLPWSQDGKLSSDQIRLTLESRMKPASPMLDDATLDQYRFEVTGTIRTRCKHCRRRGNLTLAQFMQDRLLQRILLGKKATCSWCHTGQVKLSGVRAVRRDAAPI